jgi:WD40 repeat protein
MSQKPELVTEREGHIDEVIDVCFSPDERQVLSAGIDNRLILWDLDSRKFVRTIQTTSTPKIIGFSNNGETALCILSDNLLNAFDLTDGQAIWTKSVGSLVHASIQGDSLILNHALNTTSCWDVNTGVKRWERPTEEPVNLKPSIPRLLKASIDSLEEITVHDIQYTGDGRMAVVAVGSETFLTMTTPGQPPNRHGFGGLMIWDIEADTALFPFIELPESVNALALSKDGLRCISACSDRTVSLWDLQSGMEIMRLEREPSLETHVEISPNTRRMLISRLDQTLKLFDLDQRGTLVTQDEWWDANTFCFDEDSKDVVIGNRMGSIIKLKGESLDTILVYDADQHLEVMHDFAVSPDGKKLLVGSAKESRVMFMSINQIKKSDILEFIRNDEGDILGFQTATGRVFMDSYEASIFQMPDTDVIEFMPNVNVLTVWDLENGQLDQVLYPYAYEGWVDAQDLSFSSDGNYALASIQGKSFAWDLSSGKNVRNTKGIQHFQAYHTTEGRTKVLTLQDDGQLDRWNLQDRTIEKTYDGFKKTVDVTFNYVGDKFLVLDEGGTITEIETATGSVIRKMNTTNEYLEANLQYAPLEDYIIIHSNGKAEIWHYKSNSRILKVGNEGEYSFPGDQFWDGRTAKQVSLVEFMADGQTMVSAQYDGTIQFWDFRTGDKIGTLLLPGENDWVITTPSGLFDASEGAMQNMYFRLGTEVLELEQLKDRYFEPGLLQKLLGYAPGGLRPVEDLDNIALYPKIMNARIVANKIVVQLQEREGGIGKVSLLLNDKIELEPNVNPEFTTEFEFDLDPFEAFFFSDSLNRLTLRAYNRDGWLKGQPYPVYYDPVGSKGKSLNSLTGKKNAQLESISLYALVVGTSNFRGDQLNLRYPDKDANAFAEALELAGRPLFGDNMDIRLLTTSSNPYPRKAEIAAVLSNFAEKSSPNDILLLYFSGHGITYPPNSEAGQFYYLTTDILDDKLDDPITRTTLAIGQDTLQSWIRKVKALKRILILDACNSGKVVQSLAPGEKSLNSDQRRALERMNDRSGMFVLAGSAADKVSFEASRFGHGLLTYSLLNNMPFVAASNRSYVDISNLFNSALEEVPRLAQDIGKVQKPELIAAESFDIGIIDPNANFPTPQALPVFVRTVFLDKNRNKDVQRLSKAVNKFLDEQASDQQPTMVYWDIDEFSGEHYYLGGWYEVKDKVLEGSATLYRKDEVVATIPFTGNSDQLDDLATQIIMEAFNKLN